MNDVPLVQKNDINSINTSLIAIKKQLKQLTEAVGLIDVPDLSPYVKKTDVVDVVEAGNMHSVSSNAVAESLSYSTTEQKTGGTYVDGKPIYRKVIDCGTLPNNTETFTDLNIQNLATVVSLKGMANNGAGTFLPLPYTDASLYNSVQMAVTNNKISIVTNGNRSTFSALATIEYTKTTD